MLDPATGPTTTAASAPALGPGPRNPPRLIPVAPPERDPERVISPWLVAVVIPPFLFLSLFALLFGGLILPVVAPVALIALVWG